MSHRLKALFHLSILLCRLETNRVFEFTFENAGSRGYNIPETNNPHKGKLFRIRFSKVFSLALNTTTTATTMVPPSRRKPPPPIDEEIYPDHNEELFRRAVSEDKIANTPKDVEWWFKKYERYQKEAERYFEGKAQCIRWYVETKLYMKLCKQYLHPKHQQRLIDLRGGR
jgi:hypothetical protein